MTETNSGITAKIYKNYSITKKTNSVTTAIAFNAAINTHAIAGIIDFEVEGTALNSCIYLPRIGPDVCNLGSNDLGRTNHRCT